MHLIPERYNRLVNSLAKDFKNIFLDFLEITLISVAVFILVYLFAGQLLEVTGDSMVPTFHNKEQIVAEKISIQFRPLEHGDIVIFRHPEQPTKLLIKRVIGLPNETLLLSNGYVLINQNRIEEPYVASQGNTYGSSEITDNSDFLIPPDHYVLMGDNRKESSDSRHIGAISTDLIIGRALLVFQPLKNFRLVEH